MKTKTYTQEQVDEMLSEQAAIITNHKNYYTKEKLKEMKDYVDYIVGVNEAGQLLYVRHWLNEKAYK